MLLGIVGLLAFALCVGVVSGPYMAKSLSDIFMDIGLVMLLALFVLVSAFARLDGVRFVDDGSLFGKPVASWWVLIPGSVIGVTGVLSLLLIGVGGGAMIRRTYGSRRLEV